MTEQDATTQPTDQTATSERNTGPLNVFGNIKGMFSGLAGSKKPKKKRGERSAPGSEPQLSALEKMRDKLAEFDEDYKDMGDRLLGFFTQLVGYIGPFALVFFVGNELGKFFSSAMDPISSYGLSYVIECIIAACTVAMGRAWADLATGKPGYGKAALVGGIWLVLNLSSAVALYLVMADNFPVHPTQTQLFSAIIRVCAVALADLGCSAVLMFKGRSIQKYIESMRKRATAIGELADAQRSMEEADKNAALRDQMMKSTLKIQEDLSSKIGDAVSMVMESILEKMEKALKEDNDKNERGYGRR